MIELRQGDILEAEAEALVNTVNCVGVMGRGIALQFRKAFPDVFKTYKSACDRKELHLGMVLVHDLNRLENPHLVINFPTKRHWKGNSRLDDIEAGLEALVSEIRERKIKSIAVPPLGCGLGGLDWDIVRPIIEGAFQELEDVRVYLYEPSGAPVPEEMAKESKKPNMTVGRASLINLIRRYLAAVIDPDVTLLEIHKLMYFMQEAGENLRLEFSKARYGPYANNLRHVLNVIEGHFISGYGDAEDDPDKQIELLPEAIGRAEKFVEDHPFTSVRFDRVADLIKGFETPFGMELLSTVHWVVTREGANTFDEAVKKTYSWNERKHMFKKEHICVAWKVLEEKGWLKSANA